ERARAAGDKLGEAQAEIVRLSAQTTLGTVTIGHGTKSSEKLLALFQSHGDDWGAMRATEELARHHFFAGRALVATQLLMDLRSRYPPQALPPRVDVLLR